MSKRVQYQEDLRVATKARRGGAVTRQAEELAAGAECVRVAREAVARFGRWMRGCRRRSERRVACWEGTQMGLKIVQASG